MIYYFLYLLNQVEFRHEILYGVNFRKPQVMWSISHRQFGSYPIFSVYIVSQNPTLTKQLNVTYMLHLYKRISNRGHKQGGILKYMA
jgi:hypothetical protein